MKIIVSHDVDHLLWKEHLLSDMYIPKLWARSLKLMLTGVIDRKTMQARINFWNDKRINRIKELQDYEMSLKIPACYFFVMQPGLGVSYKAEQATEMIQSLLNNGFEAGVHGMAYKDAVAIKVEYEKFKAISGMDDFGIRMHYLRSNEHSSRLLAEAGYLFDSTEYAVALPYRVGNMTEFPISIMDVYSVRPDHKSIDTAKAYTLQKIKEAEEMGIPYFTINFHDMLFDPAYAFYMDWFKWIIGLCKQRGYAFTRFSDAIKEHGSTKF